MTANGCCAIKGETKCWKGKSNPPAPTAKATTTTTTKAVATTAEGSCPRRHTFAHTSAEACYWWCHKAGFTCQECKRLDPDNCKKMKSGKKTHCCMGAANKCECIPNPKTTFGLMWKLTDEVVVREVSFLMFLPHFKEKKQLCRTKCSELGFDCEELSDEGFACCKVSGKELKGPDDCRHLPKEDLIDGWNKVNDKCKQTCKALTKNGNDIHCIGRL